MGTRRKSRRKKSRRRKKSPARRRRPPKRPRHHRRPADWRSPTSRKQVLQGLKKIAGSLAGRLVRAALFSEEAVYLRAIANLKAGKRLTDNQALAILSATRRGAPLFRSVFGAREEALVEEFSRRMTERGFERTRTIQDIMRWTPKNVNPGVALQLWHAARNDKQIYYRVPGGMTQKWSIGGFQRFISLPYYKKRWDKVFKGGTFWMATPDRKGDLPKKGKTKIAVN